MKMLDAVAREWRRRVEAEYRSAALTAQLAQQLLVIGASADLVRTALRIVDDELVHAEDAARVVADAISRGASPPEVSPTPRERLSLPRRWEPLELDVAAVCLETFCFGETVAVPIFIRMREGATEASARRALDRIVVDEVRHADFGWLLLEALVAGREGALVKDFLEAGLSEVCGRVAASYAGAADDTRIAPEARAFGLIPGAEYAAALRRAAARDYLPRLEALGFATSSLAPVKVLSSIGL